MASGVKVSKLNFELNPRGNLWFNDDSTYGHKLLSRMGWNKGKGLGKNEDGIKENIKIYKKDSNAGVGWKNVEIPVAVGCLEYENILKKLQHHFKSKNQNAEKPQVDQSLEQRSRSARNHLHYQKFVRGKDLFRYSEKDMKCIFLEKPQEKMDVCPTENCSTPTFNSQLSVKEYFAMKMQKRMKETSKVDDKSDREVADKKRKFVSEEPETPQKRTQLEHQTPVNDLHIPIESKHSIVENDVEESKEIPTGKKKKKHKKSKREKSHLQRLKSCLKNRTEYDIEGARNVSFNEQVSFKILDTSIEMCEALKEVTSHVTAEVDADEESSVAEPCNSGDVQEENTVEECEGSAEGEDTAEERPQCFDLPKCSSSNFNFWLESQRQATKMKQYKDMVKKLKKHKILGTSSLLDIKGYGNWGL